jgi:hypothetical protein
MGKGREWHTIQDEIQKRNQNETKKKDTQIISKL